jgi:general secretion pathway protein B
MSYILEALKKSDTERQQGSVPGLQTQHTLYPGFSVYKRKRSESLAKMAVPGIVSICLIIAALLLRDHFPYTILKKSTLQELSTSTTPPVNGYAQNNIERSITPSLPVVTTPHAQQGNDSLSLPVIANEPVITEQKIILQPAPILLRDYNSPLLSAAIDLPPVTDTDIEIPFIEELSPVVRANLPKMKFAGHTYSEDPAKRMILVNNSIKREGDNIETGLKLEEITWEGLVMNHRGTLFRIVTTN